MPERDGRNVSAEEHSIMEECFREALFYRTVPFATLSGVIAFASVRRGLLKPNSVFGAWPKTIVCSYVGYWVGKTSYLLGKDCQDKFLERVPEGEVAASIRRNDGLHKLRTIYRHQNLEDDKREDWSAGPTRVNVKLSEEERQILVECRLVSILYFSIPISLTLSILGYALQAKGFSKESSFLRPPFKKLPKMALGGILGYALGQLIYANSSDCLQRLLDATPNGNIAHMVQQLQRNNEHFIESINPSNLEETGEAMATEEYVIPSDRKLQLIGSEEVTDRDIIVRSLKNHRKS